MKLGIYSIYDTVACIFNKPFTDVNDASAERSFTQSAKDQINIKDYELYKLAELNDGTGEVIPLKSPQKMITGLGVAAHAADNQD